MSASPPPRQRSHQQVGLAFAVVASVTFGTSGIVARSLLNAGWSPIAAVTARAAGAALLVAPLGYVALRGDIRRLARSWKRVVALGLFGVGGAQVGYFAAVERMPVGIALLIEFQAPVMLILFTWMRTRSAPQRPTIWGAIVATLGLVLVLDLGGGTLDPVGVAWALFAAVSVAIYFHITGTPDPEELPPIALTSGALVVGTVALLLVGGVGLLPLEASTARMELLGTDVPWWLPVLAVIVVSTAIPYATSIAAMGRLGARLGSFVSLLELLSAIVFAWLVFSERPTALQALGGAFILAGILLVQNSDATPQVVRDALPDDLERTDALTH